MSTAYSGDLELQCVLFLVRFTLLVTHNKENKEFAKKGHASHSNAFFWDGLQAPRGYTHDCDW